MKKNTLKYFLLTISFALTTQASQSQGQDVLSKFPNNTNTRLASSVSMDHVVIPKQAYVFQHLFGQDLILKIMVKDLDYRKVIYIQNLDRTIHAPFALNDFEFRLGGTSALWVGKDGEYDIILVKLSGSIIVSDADTLSPHNINVYIQMAGMEFTVRNIKISLDTLKGNTEE